MTETAHSDIGSIVAAPDFEAFIARELAFCGYLVLEPFDALGAEEIETARRGLWEEWRSIDSPPHQYR